MRYIAITKDGNSHKITGDSSIDAIINSNLIDVISISVILCTYDYADFFHAFMNKQLHKIEEHKYLQSEIARTDLGNSCCIDWITKYGKIFRHEFIREYFNDNFITDVIKDVSVSTDN